MSMWASSVMWWQLYPLGFTGAPIRPDQPAERILTHRLDRIVPWPDHLIDLGLNGPLLGPMFAADTHGYDTTDFFQVLRNQGAAAPTATLCRARWDSWRPGDDVDADVFKGHCGLVALDHASPAVADIVVDVMTHWLARGIDGWRLRFC